ncbi:MAG: aromatic ring-hydroxylating dioxygenase subunit alpha [Rhodoferax sp.]|nr:aromatic ring-hydroxylating dioxygenase subunit alpha [Rhodoferax sp.]
MKSSLSWDGAPDLPPTHYVNNRIYTDPQIFEEERLKIMASTWRLACHESELPDPGDYRATEIAGIPIVILRGEDCSIRAFFNVCPHRGAKLVRDERGNAKRGMQCFYHLWTFSLDGKCTSITRGKGYENCGLDREKVGLRVVKTEVFCGLVFVCLKDDVPPLGKFLGGMADHIKAHLGQDELEVFHYHRAIINTNWKLFVDNNSELYHEFLHVLNRRTAVAHKSYNDRSWILYPGSHNIIQQGVIHYDSFGLDQRTEGTLPGMHPNGMVVMLLFPDVMINIRATVMRIDTMTPIAPDKTLVEWRGVGLKSDTAEMREMRIRQHNEVWGPAGRNLPEDMAAVEAQWETMVHGGSKYSIFAREEGLKPQDDSNLRAFYQQWSKHIGHSPNDPFGLYKTESDGNRDKGIVHV